jgi:hypothetical protein
MYLISNNYSISEILDSHSGNVIGCDDVVLGCGAVPCGLAGRYLPEQQHRHLHRENLKSHTLIVVFSVVTPRCLESGYQCFEERIAFIPKGPP